MKPPEQPNSRNPPPTITPPDDTPLQINPLLTSLPPPPGLYFGWSPPPHLRPPPGVDLHGPTPHFGSTPVLLLPPPHTTRHTLLYLFVIVGVIMFYFCVTWPVFLMFVTTIPIPRSTPPRALLSRVAPSLHPRRPIDGLLSPSGHSTVSHPPPAIYTPPPPPHPILRAHFI